MFCGESLSCDILTWSISRGWGYFKWPFSPPPPPSFRKLCCNYFLIGNAPPPLAVFPRKTHRDDNDKYIHKDKCKEKDTTNSKVTALMYIGCNATPLEDEEREKTQRDRDLQALMLLSWCCVVILLFWRNLLAKWFFLWFTNLCLETN